MLFIGINMNYISSGTACKMLDITRPTLKSYREEGRIQCLRLSSKKILYDIDSIMKIDGNQDGRINVIYGRVSNTKQVSDLQKQVQMITNYMISNGIKPDEIFEEVASGMNENRSQLNKLIQLVIEKKVNRIYISYKDRLTRFGFDYFKNWFSQFGTSIEVINATKEEDFQSELTQDLVSIIHHFSMKMYSNRRKELKLAMKALNEKLDEPINTNM
jgi:predicted site-specific integrase-resolvase